MASITAPARTAFDSKSPLLLPVPYFSQRDSATGQGDRMCFSSTCAMAAEFLKPGLDYADDSANDTVSP